AAHPRSPAVQADLDRLCHSHAYHHHRHCGVHAAVRQLHAHGSQNALHPAVLVYFWRPASGPLHPRLARASCPTLDVGRLCLLAAVLYRQPLCTRRHLATRISWENFFFGLLSSSVACCSPAFSPTARPTALPNKHRPPPAPSPSL